MTRRLVLALAVAVAGAALVGVAALSSGDDGERAGRAPTATRAPDLNECRRLGGDLARACYTREYLAAVAGSDDPRPAVEAIADSAWKEGPALDE